MNFAIFADIFDATSLKIIDYDSLLSTDPQIIMSLLGIDVGSTGCKSIVFSEKGKILGSGFQEYGMVYGEKAKAEQDAEKIWSIVCDVTGKAIADSGQRQISALSASVQGDGIIPVDKDYMPLHNAILGMDYRSRDFALRCSEIFGEKELFKMTGMRPHPMNSLTKLLWFRDSFPDLFSRVFKIMTYSDFILKKFMGKAGQSVIDNTMASRTMAYDIHKRDWSEDILDKLKLDKKVFSETAPSGTVIGHLDKTIQEKFGLKDGVKIVTGGHDQTCAAIGAGLIKEGLGLISTGTAEVMSASSNRPMLNSRMFKSYFPCYIHAKDDMFFTFTLNHVGGLLFKWFRDNFAEVDHEKAGKEGLSTYKYLTDRMPDKISDIFFLPHLNGSGTPICDLSSKGAVIGLKISHDKYDIVRAILESQVYELKINMESLESAGVELHEFNSVGGGSKSPAWLQIKSDILEREISTLENPEAACLGAAILAGFASGKYSSLEEGVDATVKKDISFAPDPKKVKVYREKFNIYKDIYPALKDINHRI